jgi:putative restriction endonuclease
MAITIPIGAVSVALEGLGTEELLELFGETTRVEVHDGNLVANAPSTAAHQRTAHRVFDWLARQRPEPQWWVLTGVGLGIPGGGPEQRYIPDVVVMAPLDINEPRSAVEEPRAVRAGGRGCVSDHEAHRSRSQAGGLPSRRPDLLDRRPR